MITKIFISTVLVLMLASCNNNRTQDKPKQEIPKALEDKSSSYDLVSKRSYDDLIESLYNELVSKNIDLKQLEDRIDSLNRSKGEATDLFINFDGKNQAYYSSADRHISEINDSLLRDKMKVLIANNLTRYKSSIARHKELLEIVESNGLTISDLHNVLKIVKTLPLIENYQKDNLPNTKSIEGFIKRQEEVIGVIDTLATK